MGGFTAVAFPKDISYTETRQADYRCLMSSVTEHYATHLGPVYTWMAGGVEAAIARGAKEIEALAPVDKLARDPVAVVAPDPEPRPDDRAP